MADCSSFGSNNQAQKKNTDKHAAPPFCYKAFDGQGTFLYHLAMSTNRRSYYTESSPPSYDRSGPTGLLVPPVGGTGSQADLLRPANPPTVTADGSHAQAGVDVSIHCILNLFNMLNLRLSPVESRPCFHGFPVWSSSCEHLQAAISTPIADEHFF